MRLRIGTAGWSALTVLLALGMVMSSTSAAMAQATQSHSTADGKHTVEWEGNWELEDSQGEAGVAELLFFTNGLSLLNVGFFPSGYDLEEMRDTVLSGLEEGSESSLAVVDSGAYDNVAYELDTIEINDVTFGVWVVVIDRGAAADTTVMIFGAPVPRFAESMAVAQSEVTIDGEEIFKGIDPQGLQDLLGTPADAASSSTSGSSSRTGSTSTGTSSSQSASSSYTSPVWGYTVQYGGPWSSGADVGEFGLSSSTPLAVIGFEGLDLQGVPLIMAHDVVVPIFEDSLPLGSQMIANVVGGDRILLAATTPDGVMVQELIQLPSGVTVMVIMMFQGNADTVFSMANQNISVNGMPLFIHWDSI